jgi:hypothetical protein
MKRYSKTCIHRENQIKERRKFPRFEFFEPLTYKICKKKIVSKLLEGYTSNISRAGLCCNIKEKVRQNDILWLSFDRQTLDFCKDLERDSFIYQKGLFSKVVWVKLKKDRTYDVGVRFLTRKEKVKDFIYPLVKLYGLDYKEPEEVVEPYP